jgi:hypothetical protein
MKKHLFLGSFLLLGTSLFGQTLSSTPSKEKQTETAELGAKPLSEASKNQTLNTSRNQPKKIKTTVVRETKIETKKEDEK